MAGGPDQWRGQQADLQWQRSRRQGPSSKLAGVIISWPPSFVSPSELSELDEPYP